jgi:hypothetical protein
MGTAVMTHSTWESYYQTMAAAERVRLKFAEVKDHVWRTYQDVVLRKPFKNVTDDVEKLVSMLERLNSLPSSILLEDDLVELPTSLQQLFRTICSVIEQTEALNLHEGFFLKELVSKLRLLSQRISDFAVRFHEAQTLLRSRVPADEVAAYQDSFGAYIKTVPESEQASEEDVQERSLRF